MVSEILCTIQAVFFKIQFNDPLVAIAIADNI